MFVYDPTTACIKCGLHAPGKCSGNVWYTICGAAVLSLLHFPGYRPELLEYLVANLPSPVKIGMFIIIAAKTEQLPIK
jgi:hypothetical protein